ncbi:ComEC/Rec2 family competence protein [Chitinophaga nivalis]|uniref:Competence protein ComEC family protein n=1 Tax=Chitinophaga nivalis TaxID=2991709 RepID=A0ABT3IVS9_9BACT|nr:ComEC/Rec2 family competence protein [Chitinophaga nivalis]MCW3462223.1 competence protein ComEC family protein [Chitinophaga nivalis]MCW3488085.1 competence protein ComEC family protein [Chitinophaga nivalis]
MQFESSLPETTYWKRVPFLRLVTPLLAGITAQYYFSFSPACIWLLLVFPATGWLLFRLLPVHRRFAIALVPGILLCVAIAAAGCWLVHQADIRYQQGFFATMTTDSTLLVLRVTTPPEEDPRSFKATGVVTAIGSGGHWWPAKGNIRLFVRKDSSSNMLRYGDEILVKNQVTPIRSNGNPGAFDYRRYCALQQCYHQLYLRPGEYRKLLQQRGNPIMRAIIHLRRYCLDNLKKYIGSGPEAGMAEALLIGYRRDLEKEIVQSYSNTGIVHVIAISGMHLALLYGSLLWLLQWLPAARWADSLKAVIVLSFLWGFALLTGASASVLRSAVMFTGITIGRFVLQRYTCIYNTLAASAFVLLCYDPSLAMDAGFQLSYLAVLSILLFYTPIYELLSCRQKWLDVCWQMVALSLAAQLLTTPISLYYFHQFPVYFLPANLIAVPLSTLIIYAAAILLFIAPMAAPAAWLGWGIKYLILLMNTCVEWLGKLPGAAIPAIQLNNYQVVSMYVLMGGLALWIMVKWQPGWWLFLAGIAGCIALHAVEIIACNRQRKLVIYNVGAYTAIDYMNGRQVQFIGDDSIWRSPVAAQLQAARNTRRVSPAQIPGCTQYGRYVRLGNRQLVMIDSALPRQLPHKKFVADYLLLAHNPRVQIPQLQAHYDCRLIIFAASNSHYRLQQWKKECRELHQLFYVIGEEGAFIREL